MKKVFDLGSGRAVTLISESDSIYAPLFADVANYSEQRLTGRTVGIELERLVESRWEKIRDELIRIFNQEGIRQTVLVAGGSAVTVAIATFLSEPKLVRALLLVDPVFRAHPTLRTKFIDRIDRSLPFGLPIRGSGQLFPMASSLHRVRRPVLVVSSHNASQKLQEEADDFTKKLPTAWRARLDTDCDSHRNNLRLGDLIEQLQQVDTKRPQKSLSLVKSS